MSVLCLPSKQTKEQDHTGLFIHMTHSCLSLVSRSPGLPSLSFPGIRRRRQIILSQPRPRDAPVGSARFGLLHRHLHFHFESRIPVNRGPRLPAAKGGGCRGPLLELSRSIGWRETSPLKSGDPDRSLPPPCPYLVRAALSQGRAVAS